MSKDDSFQRVRAGVCAVGYFIVPIDQVAHYGDRQVMNIAGTGFLVRETTIITNRHIVEAMYAASKEFGVPLAERACALFVYPHGTGWQTAYARIAAVTDSVQIAPDIAFLEIEPPPAGIMAPCQPVAVGDALDVRVGQEVSVCGYPLGTALLEREEKTFRFGTVLQQGYVSAKAPFDHAFVVDELLLDLRATFGMSGSPVFLPDDGVVVGVIRGGHEAVTALAVPIQPESLERWLDIHDEERHSFS